MLLELNDITDNSYQQINGIFIHPDICLNSVVYKYIKREHLHEMIQNHQLYVANRKSFSDRREQQFKENLQKRFIIAPASIPSYNKNYYKTLSKKYIRLAKDKAGILNGSSLFLRTFSGKSKR